MDNWTAFGSASITCLMALDESILPYTGLRQKSHFCTWSPNILTPPAISPNQPTWYPQQDRSRALRASHSAAHATRSTISGRGNASSSPRRRVVCHWGTAAWRCTDKNACAARGVARRARGGRPCAGEGTRAVLRVVEVVRKRARRPRAHRSWASGPERARVFTEADDFGVGDSAGDGI